MMGKKRKWLVDASDVPREVMAETLSDAINNVLEYIAIIPAKPRKSDYLE